MGLMYKLRTKAWKILSRIYPAYLRKIYKMNIAKNVVISYKAKLDKSINPKGIYIGKYSYILANSLILSHDASRRLIADTVIGERCIIGVNSIILPGVTIGDSSIVGAGSVVTKDVPPNCIVAGNPAKIIREGITIGKHGFIIQDIKD